MTKRNANLRLANDIQNTARLLGSIGPHRLIVGCGPRGANYTCMAQGLRHRVEALYRLAGDVSIGNFTAEQVQSWL